MLNIIKQNIDFLNDSKNLISRPKYSKILKDFLETKNIVVISWMRRVGKSFVVLDVMKTYYKDKNIFYFSKELDYENKISDSNSLWFFFKFYVEKYNEPEIIVIDEIQDIENWENFIRYLCTLWKYKIVITWSNSNLLNKELSTYIAWRYLELKIYPLDYFEFLEFKKSSQNEENLKEYFIYWGLPQIALLSNEFEKRIYLEMIKDSIFLKDIVSRFFIKNISLFEKLMKFLADNIGQYTTARNIENYLKNQNIKLSLPTILDYIKYSEISYFVNSIWRYDIKWKKILEYNEKYYFTDIWLRNSLIWKFNLLDISQILENIIYMFLLSKWYNLKIWNLKDKEIDFIAEKWWIKKYIQVAVNIDLKTTLEREVNNLLEIDDNFEKYIIVLEKYMFWELKWVKIINFVEIFKIF